MLKLGSLVSASLFLLWLSVAWAPPPQSATAEERQLLAAILAHPDEDTVRLVYADWLDENDRPKRAEFVRLQVELARMDVKDKNYKSRRARERELLQDPEATAIPTAFAKYPLQIQEREPLRPMTANPIEAVMLAQIFENPFVDWPRNAYASWLDEQGHHNEADLIRLVIQQYRGGGLPEHSDERRRTIAELTKKTRGKLDPLVLAFPELRTIPVYKRGFLEELVVPPEAFFGKDNVLDTAPFLRKLSIVGATTLPRLEQLVALLAASEVTPRLESLQLRDLVLSGEQLRTLTGKLKGLRHLALGPRKLSGDDIVELLRTPLAAQLLTLEIFPENGSDPRVREALRTFFQRRPRPKLQAIDSVLYALLPPEQQKTIRSIASPEGMCGEFVHTLVQPFP